MSPRELTKKAMRSPSVRAIDSAARRAASSHEMRRKPASPGRRNERIGHAAEAVQLLVRHRAQRANVAERRVGNRRAWC